MLFTYLALLVYNDLSVALPLTFFYIVKLLLSQISHDQMIEEGLKR